MQFVYVVFPPVGKLESERKQTVTTHPKNEFKVSTIVLTVMVLLDNKGSWTAEYETGKD